MEARIAAAEVRENFHRISTKFHDGDVSKKLAEIDQEFQDAINASNATPETIKAATEKAKGEFDEALEGAAQRRAELTTQIAAWRGALGVAESQPPQVSVLVEEFLNRLDAQEKALTAGS